MKLYLFKQGKKNSENYPESEIIASICTFLSIWQNEREKKSKNSFQPSLSFQNTQN